MLASPGRSPRHISSTPSSVDGDGDGAVALVPAKPAQKTLMGPPPPKRPRKAAVVLDEDTYVAAIEKIIERDFFPDIPKLRDRMEWLEAIRTGDLVAIREAQLSIIRRRRDRSDMAAGTPASVMAATPASFLDTPGSAMVSPSPLRTPMNTFEEQDIPSSSEGNTSIDTSVSLDDFLNKYTSEDNASFSKLLEKVNKKRREKYKHLSAEELISPQNRIADRDQNSTDGFGTSGQPVGSLEGWNYKAKNLLMYDSSERQDAPLTEAEMEERLKGLTKEINRKNTRFHGQMFDSRIREEEAALPLYSPLPGATPLSSWNLSESEKLKAKYDLEDLRKTPQVVSDKDVNKILGRGGTSGYNFVATPSPAPGVEESPFMTWGEIEGTPLRLETEETPVGIGGNGDGPQFKIPAPPSRDARAHSLSRDAARSLREKQKMFQPRSSPSPARGSGSPSIRGLSAAAQDFVRKAMAKSSGLVDAKLRASYGGNSSPYTPKSVRGGSRFREGSVRAGSVPLSSPSIREGSLPPSSP